MSGYLVTRQDGSTAWLEDSAAAVAYAADVGGTVEPYNGDEKTPADEDSTGDTQSAHAGENAGE